MGRYPVPGTSRWVKLGIDRDPAHDLAPVLTQQLLMAGTGVFLFPRLALLIEKYKASVY